MAESPGNGDVDDRIADMAKFLERARLRPGTVTDMAPPVAELLAEAVVHWLDGRVWSDGDFRPIEGLETDPDVGDIVVEQLGDSGVVKITHRSTGVTALGETAPEAWDELKRKVADHG